MTWTLSKALVEDFANSLSLQVQVGESSADFFTVGEPSAPSSGNLMPHTFLSPDKTTEPFALSQSGTTCRPSTETLGEDVLTWCLADFHARTSAAPGKASASVVRVRDFGRTWLALWTKYDPDTSGWRIPRSLLDEGSTMFLETLPRWGSMRDGELWQRRTLVRLTNGTAYGSLPTPVKYDAHGTWESNNYHGLGWLGKHGHKATDEELREAGDTQAQSLLFPTPRALDHNKRGDFNVDDKRNGLPAAVRKRVMHPTPMAGAHGLDGGSNSRAAYARRLASEWPTPMTNGLRGGSQAPKDLKERIRAYPTPTATDGERGSRWQGQGATITDGGMMVAQGDGRTHQMGLRAVVSTMERLEVGVPTSRNGLRGGSGSPHHPGQWMHPGHPEHGELNPAWVEWLMDWPNGWTSLEPLDPVDFKLWQFTTTIPLCDEFDSAWWGADPSSDGRVPRTCHKDLPNRVDRIAALGNGQVSAACAAAFDHLFNLEFPT